MQLTLRFYKHDDDNDDDNFEDGDSRSTYGVDLDSGLRTHRETAEDDDIVAKDVKISTDQFPPKKN